jgi:multicomponent Na+:H+ antiporter subunit D
MRGIGRVMPITTFAFLIGSLSIIGLPPFGGMWSKWYLALGALDAGKQIMVAVLMVSSLLNIAYLLPIPIRGFFSEPDDNPGHGAGVHEAPWPCVLALSVSAVGCIVLFFFPEPVYNLLAGMFAR